MLRIVTLWISLSVFFSMANEVTGLNPVETLKVESKHLKQPFQFNITLPASYKKAEHKTYPVIFDLHPRSQPYLSGMHDWLSHNSERPWIETIVVTPAIHHQGFNALLNETVADPDNQRLLDLLEKDVLAAVDKTYRTNGFRIFNGFMRSGTVGLYALMNRPNIFNAYIISTPTLANDFLNISSKAKQRLPVLNDKIRVLQLSTGDHRFEKSQAKAIAQFKNDLEQLAPVELEWALTNEQGHYMARPLVNVINGIEKVFKDYHQHLSADSNISRQGADAIVAHYKDLSEKRYGFVVSAERSLSNLAYSLIDSSPAESFAILKRVISLYPESASAFQSIAAAYAHVEDFSNALKFQRMAVEKSAGMPGWYQNRLESTLTDYESKNDQ